MKPGMAEILCSASDFELADEEFMKLLIHPLLAKLRTDLAIDGSEKHIRLRLTAIPVPEAQLAINE